MLPRARRDRLHVRQQLLHQLGRFLKHNLLVLLRYQALLALDLRRCNFPVQNGTLEQFQDVVHRDGSFRWVVKVDFDHDFKLSPARFGHFEGGLCDHAIGVGVAFVQFEVDFLHVRGHVLVLVRLYVHRPLVRVAVFFALLAE